MNEQKEYDIIPDDRNLLNIDKVGSDNKFINFYEKIYFNKNSNIYIYTKEYIDLNQGCLFFSEKLFLKEKISVEEMKDAKERMSKLYHQFKQQI